MLKVGKGLLGITPINIRSQFASAGSTVNYRDGTDELAIIRVGDNRVQITSNAGDWPVVGFILRRY